jgi:cysteine desulfurase / selenocysteine lyase
MPASSAPSEQLFPASTLKAIRDRFHHTEGDPYTGSRIYLENAGGGLTLKTVLEADAAIASLPDNAGRNNPSSREISRVLKAGKADIATLLNATEGTILSEQSTTACAFRILDAAAAGIKGSNIVCSCLDHASFYDASTKIADRYGLERRVAPLNPATGALDPQAVADLADEHTVSVSIIHASNITGGKTDLSAVAAAVRAKAPQAILIADGAQHVQHGIVDVSGVAIDAYVFSAYKLFSKPGFGFAYLSPRLANLPHAQLLGKPGSDWDLGTRDPGGFAAMSQVIDYFSWLAGEIDPHAPADRRGRIVAAIHAIESHEAALSQVLLHGHEKLAGLINHPRVVLHGRQHHCDGREAVFAFSVTGVHTNKLVQEFVRRRIIVHDRVSDAYSRHTMEALGVPAIVRVSLAHYNSPAEVHAFLIALNEILG